MRAPALRVPLAQGEEVRRRLADLGCVRPDLEIRVDGDALLLPLVEPSDLPTDLGPATEAEFEPRSSRGPAGYRDLLDWPEVDKALLPRSFDVIGDVVLVRLPAALDARRGEIGDALLRFVPHARVVGVDRGVAGEARLRRIERIAGAGGWSTRHRENEIELDVDVERAYFSPRLAREHARVADAVTPGETVYDLCCGVGPFAVAIALAGRARLVRAVDANPDAVRLLRSTAARYRLDTRLAAEVDRVERWGPHQPPADRVVFNLPREGIKYLAQVAPLVAPGGQLHYYEIVPREELQDRGEVLVATALGHGDWSVVDTHEVHPYSPHSDLVAFLFGRRPERSEYA